LISPLIRSLFLVTLRFMKPLFLSLRSHPLPHPTLISYRSLILHLLFLLVVPVFQVLRLLGLLLHPLPQIAPLPLLTSCRRLLPAVLSGRSFRLQYVAHRLLPRVRLAHLEVTSRLPACGPTRMATATASSRRCLFGALKFNKHGSIFVLLDKKFLILN
jgi:hypothetical protein